MVREIFLFGLKCYKNFFFGLFPSSCRFYPSCSEYTEKAIEKKGLLKGVFWGIFRILRCNPLVPGGFDPVE